MGIGYGFCETGSEVPVSICILVKCIVPILVWSHTNWDLNVSNNLSGDFNFWGKVINTVNYIDVCIKSLLGVLIVDEVCHLVIVHVL